MLYNNKNSTEKKKLIIVGGGTAGWLTAAAFIHQLSHFIDVTLIESDQIPTVGVGEATIPPIRAIHRLLGIEEKEFLAHTDATFKLGIQFDNWKASNTSYFHAFGSVGQICWAGEFQHFFTQGVQSGMSLNFGDYSYETQAALSGKFTLNKDADLNYAYHIDAGKYAKFLRKISEKRGVKRVEGKIEHVINDTSTGHIQSVQLQNGDQIKGDFFIDCSGFRSLLSQKTLKTPFEDWSHWLFANTAVTCQTTHARPVAPFTISKASYAGWQWKIPLRSRVGNGFVFSNNHITEENAAEHLLKNIEGDTINEPRFVRFKTGKLKNIWEKNCVAIGLSSGFIEPLESTSIHLICVGILKLMKLFPFYGYSDIAIKEYNQQLDTEMEQIRDFIILHYCVNARQSDPMWNDYRNMALPDSLQHKISLFKENAALFINDNDLFRVDSWAQVMIGQGLQPSLAHPLPLSMGEDNLKKFFLKIRGNIQQKVSGLPSHHHFVKRFNMPEVSNTVPC